MKKVMRRLRCPLIILVSSIVLVACPSHFDEVTGIEDLIVTENPIPTPIPTPRPIGTIAPVVKWHWSGSKLQPESNQVMCSPVVININDDNGDGSIDQKDIPDIIFNTFIGGGYNNGGGTLRALSGDGSGELWAVLDFPTNPVANLAVGDIDNDGTPEILAFSGVRETTGSKLLAFNNDGSLKWQSQEVLGGSDICIVDIDCDGIPEIIVSSAVLDNQGNTLWKANFGTFCVADLDNSGFMEIVGKNKAYRHDGTIYWEAALLNTRYMAIGNFDSDIYPEIVCVGTSSGPTLPGSPPISTTKTEVYMLEHDGTVKWGPKIFFPDEGLRNGGGGAPALADLDGDGSLEIIFATSCALMVLDASGEIKWEVAIQDTSSGVCGVTAFDFDGNGVMEIAFADMYRFCLYDGISGEILYELPVGNGTITEIPIVADVNGDGKAEIVITASNYWNSAMKTGIIVIGDPSWFPTRPLWNQHSYHIDNIHSSGSIPKNEAKSWLTHNSYRCNEKLE